MVLQQNHVDEDENKTDSSNNNKWKPGFIALIIILIIVVIIIVIYVATKSKKPDAWRGMTEAYIGQVQQAQNILDGFGSRVKELATTQRSNCYNNIIIPNTPLDENMFRPPPAMPTTPGSQFDRRLRWGQNITGPTVS